jgi:hypothetical protein
MNIIEETVSETSLTTYAVICTNCGSSSGKRYSIRETIYVWNQRFAPQYCECKPDFTEEQLERYERDYIYYQMWDMVPSKHIQRMLVRAMKQIQRDKDKKAIES